MRIHSAQISLYKQLPALAHKANTGYASFIRCTVIASVHIKLTHLRTHMNGCVHVIYYF